MVFTVMAGAEISSVRYKRRKEGSAKVTNTRAGRTVQIVSTMCASVVKRDVYRLLMRAMRA